LTGAKIADSVGSEFEALVDALAIALEAFVDSERFGASFEDGFDDGFCFGEKRVVDHFVSAGGFDDSGLADGLEVVAEGALSEFETVDHFADAEVGVHEGVDDPDPGWVGKGFAQEHYVIHCHIRIPGFDRVARFYLPHPRAPSPLKRRGGILPVRGGGFTGDEAGRPSGLEVVTADGAGDIEHFTREV